MVKVHLSLKTSEPKKNNTSHIKSINERTNLFDFIIGGEGSVQLKSFCDSYVKKNGHLYRKKGKSCTRWSIGYGTISYWGETITKDEAHIRMQGYLKHRIKKIPSCWTKNQSIAIVDYQYQFGDSSRNIHKYIKRCSYKDIKYILYPYNRYAKGIEKRRVRGYNLYLLIQR